MRHAACCRDVAVPSFAHDLLVDLFRSRGELAPALLRSCAGIVLDHDHVEQSSVDLSQVASTEYRADAVVVLRDRADVAVAAVVVEVQLSIDADKRRSWPQYLTALDARHACPTVLLVVAPDARVARWARAPIPLGHPGFSLVPIVVGFDDVPRRGAGEGGRHLPELDVLAAMAHPELEVAINAIAALAGLPEDRARLYLDVILMALSPSDREILEARMQGYEYQSDFARKYYYQGPEEGREQGLRTAAVALLRAKLGDATQADQPVIEALHDGAALTELIGALARATGAVEVRAALAAASIQR